MKKMKNGIKNKRGFTLIECVIAIAVIMIVSMAALMITQQSSKADPDITSFYKAKSLSDGMLSSFQYTHDYAAYQNAIKDRAKNSGGTGKDPTVEGETDETPTDPKLNAFIGNYNITNIKKNGTKLVFTIGDESEGNGFEYDYGSEENADEMLIKLTTGGQKIGKDEYVYTCDATATEGLIFKTNFYMRLTRTVVIDYNARVIKCTDVIKCYDEQRNGNWKELSYGNIFKPSDPVTRYYNGTSWVADEYSFASYEDLIVAAPKIAGKPDQHPNDIKLDGVNPNKNTFLFGVSFKYSDTTEKVKCGNVADSFTNDDITVKYFNCAKSSKISDKYTTTLDFNQIYLDENSLYLKLYTKEGGSDSIADKLRFDFANQADLLYFFGTNFTNYAVGNEELSTAQTLSDATKTVNSILKRGDILKFGLDGNWIESGSIASLIEGKRANQWYWGDDLEHAINFGGKDEGYTFEKDGETYWLKSGASGYLKDNTAEGMIASSTANLKKTGKCGENDYLWDTGSPITITDKNLWQVTAVVNLPGYASKNNGVRYLYLDGSTVKTSTDEKQISESDAVSLVNKDAKAEITFEEIKGTETRYRIKRTGKYTGDVEYYGDGFLGSNWVSEENRASLYTDDEKDSAFNQIRKSTALFEYELESVNASITRYYAKFTSTLDMQTTYYSSNIYKNFTQTMPSFSECYSSDQAAKNAVKALADYVTVTSRGREDHYYFTQFKDAKKVACLAAISIDVNGNTKYWNRGTKEFSLTDPVKIGEWVWETDNPKDEYLSSLMTSSDYYSDGTNSYWNPTIIPLTKINLNYISVNGKYWNGSDFVSDNKYYEDSKIEEQQNSVKGNTNTAAAYPGTWTYSEQATYYFNDINPANAYRKIAIATLDGIKLNENVNEMMFDDVFAEVKNNKSFKEQIVFNYQLKVSKLKINGSVINFFDTNNAIVGSLPWKNENTTVVNNGEYNGSSEIAITPVAIEIMTEELRGGENPKVRLTVRDVSDAGNIVYQVVLEGDEWIRLAEDQGFTVNEKIGADGAVTCFYHCTVGLEKKYTVVAIADFGHSQFISFVLDGEHNINWQSESIGIDYENGAKLKGFNTDDIVYYSVSEGNHIYTKG